MAIVLLGVMSLIAGPLTAASAATQPSTTHGVRLRNIFSDKCVDVDITANGANGSKIQVWTCNNQSQQVWFFYPTDPGWYTIKSARYIKKCLDADTNTIKMDGGKVQLWDCNGSRQQQWDFYQNQGEIAVMFNRLVNRVLDVDVSRPVGDGTKIQLWQQNNLNQQKFYWY